MGIRVQFALFARDKYVSRDQDLWPGNRDKGREGGGRQTNRQTEWERKIKREGKRKRKIIPWENINEAWTFADNVERAELLNLWSDFSTVGRRSLNEWPLKGNIFPHLGFPNHVKGTFRKSGKGGSGEQRKNPRGEVEFFQRMKLNDSRRKSSFKSVFALVFSSGWKRGGSGGEDFFEGMVKGTTDSRNDNPSGQVQVSSLE